MSNQRNAELVDELYAPSYVEHPLWLQPHLPRVMGGKRLVALRSVNGVG
jgi:hypothetical protein